jgi:hypothetical protein
MNAGDCLLAVPRSGSASRAWTRRAGRAVGDQEDLPRLQHDCWTHQERSAAGQTGREGHIETGRVPAGCGAGVRRPVPVVADGRPHGVDLDRAGPYAEHRLHRPRRPVEGPRTLPPRRVRSGVPGRELVPGRHGRRPRRGARHRPGGFPRGRYGDRQYRHDLRRPEFRRRGLAPLPETAGEGPGRIAGESDEVGEEEAQSPRAQGIAHHRPCEPPDRENACRRGGHERQAPDFSPG